MFRVAQPSLEPVTPVFTREIPEKCQASDTSDHGPAFPVRSSDCTGDHVAMCRC